MANESYLHKPEETTPTGLRFWGKKSDIGSPTGFIDVWISFENIIASTLALIANIGSTLTAFSARIASLESITTKSIDLNKNSSYTFTLDTLDHSIDKIYVKWISGSPTIKIGTTSGGYDIVPGIDEVITLSSTDNIKEFVIGTAFAATQQFYVTINSGTVHIAKFYTSNIFNL